MTSIVVGVLAMQGAFRDHAQVLNELGVETVEVRTADQLGEVDGLVLPGGESTAIRKMLVRSELYEPLRERLEQGMPALATCAGLIVLSSAEPDGAPDCYGLLDLQVERNGFGRQPHSFEAPVTVDLEQRAESINGVFIRAPRISALGDGVEVLARLADGEPVAVRQGALIGCTFHPELAGASVLHELFVGVCREEVARGRT